MVCDNLEKWLTLDESESEKVGLKLNIQHSEN